MFVSIIAYSNINLKNKLLHSSSQQLTTPWHLLLLNYVVKLMITMLFSSALTSFFTVQDDFVLLTWDYPLYQARIWELYVPPSLIMVKTAGYRLKINWLFGSPAPII